MENNFRSPNCVGDNLNYMIGYYFRCRLSYKNFNHKRDRYDVEVVVHTSNFHCWVEELCKVLLDADNIPLINCLMI